MQSLSVTLQLKRPGRIIKSKAIVDDADSPDATMTPVSDPVMEGVIPLTDDPVCLFHSFSLDLDPLKIFVARLSSLW